MILGLLIKYGFGLSLIGFVAVLSFHQGRFRISENSLIVLGAAVAVFFHSLVLSSQPEVSLERSVFAIIFLFALSLLPLNMPRPLSQLALNVWRNFMVVTVIVNFALIFVPISLFYNSGNFRGLFNNANYLGLVFSIFFLPYCIYLMYYLQAGHQKLYKILFWLIVITILASRSRSALLVLLMIITISLYKGDLRLPGGGWVARIIAAVPMLGLILSYERISQKYDNSVSQAALGAATDYLWFLSELPLFSTRLIFYAHRIQGIIEKPLWGWGYGINSAEGRMIEPYVFNLLEKGNTPLMLLEEFGLILGSIFTMLFIRLFILAYRKWKVNPFAASVVIAALIHSMFETWILNFNSMAAWGFWLCIMVVISRSAHNKN
jgi:O-antigen ligase